MAHVFNTCVCVQIAREHHRSHFRSILCHSNMFDLLATRVASTPGLDDDITDILSMRLQHAPIADVELAVEPVVEQAIVPAVPHVEPVAARVPKRKLYNTYVNGVRHRWHGNAQECICWVQPRSMHTDDPIWRSLTRWLAEGAGVTREQHLQSARDVKVSFGMRPR